MDFRVILNVKLKEDKKKKSLIFNWILQSSKSQQKKISLPVKEQKMESSFQIQKNIIFLWRKDF